eukprot:350949-Chlamydomonas_euryale.AAC.3
MLQQTQDIGTYRARGRGGQGLWAWRGDDPAGLEGSARRGEHRKRSDGTGRRVCLEFVACQVFTDADALNAFMHDV